MRLGRTVLEAVAEHFHWFTNHPGISKQAVNIFLPKAVRIVKPYLVEPIIYDVCPNDSVISHSIISGLEKCPKFSTDRFKSTGSTRIPVRTFYYLPLRTCIKVHQIWQN